MDFVTCACLLTHSSFPPHQTLSRQMSVQSSSSGISEFLANTNQDALESLKGDLDKLLHTIPSPVKPV